MRATSVLAILISLLVLSSGCKKPDAEPLCSVYDAAPASSGSQVNIGGVSAEIYKTGEMQYIKGADLAAALGGSIEIFKGVEDHQAVITTESATYSFTTYEGEQNTSEIYSFKNCLFDGTDWYCPREAILTYLELHELEDAEQKVTYYTAYPQARDIPAGVEIPVLMYHAVSDNRWGIDSLFVSPSAMEEQLRYLTENGYTPIWFEDLANVNRIEKPIILTFDDGYGDNYTELLPLLKKYNVKATVFMITGSIGKTHYLTAEQLGEMSQSGLISVQSHTVTHEFLSTRSAAQLEEELVQSKLTLTRITGKEPFVLCYPTGKYSDVSLAATAEHYQFGLLMSGKTYVTGEDPLKICRKYISRSTSLEEFIAMIE